MRTDSQRGFTLIELMISLVLGLIISAAVLQVYISYIRTSTIQKGGSEITESSVFGIQDLEQQIRMTNLGNLDNLGNAITAINQITPFGGVVLSPQNLSLPATDTSVSPALYTRSTGDTVGTGNQWTGATGTNIGSDQLTIQFKNETGEQIFDCEGNAVAVDEIVIMRYFVRADGSSRALACDAGRVNTAGGLINGASSAQNLGGQGALLITNIEQFKVLLGVKNPAGDMAYISPHDYMALANTHDLYRAPIVAIKLGYLVRSERPTVGEDTPNSFNILGGTNTVNGDYVRRPYESTIMLRNARVITLP